MRQELWARKEEGETSGGGELFPQCLANVYDSYQGCVFFFHNYSIKGWDHSTEFERNLQNSITSAWHNCRSSVSLI